MAFLEVRNLTKDFGGIVANNDVSFSIEEGEIVGLIGPNGAGKTTLFNCIVGYYRPDGGRVIFRGRDITGWKPFQTAREGIGRTFQLMRAAGELTALEHVMVGAFLHQEDRVEAEKEAREVLAFMGLEGVADLYLTELPLAIQKQVGLARALAIKPVLLMLDEVASGLNPTETEEMVKLLKRIHREKGITLFLIEHVMEVVMPISERVIVLDGGMKIAEGPPEEIAHDEKVIKAYLGEKYARGL
ncbi:MAG: ABC transporter ATP-binding protein [Deltaproteobacteria bacterium]|nr:MAG: ABC transporter ATP-binding protein [Deltaproteobacteria bacterium]